MRMENVVRKDDEKVVVGSRRDDDDHLRSPKKKTRNNAAAANSNPGDTPASVPSKFQEGDMISNAIDEALLKHENAHGTVDKLLAEELNSLCMSEREEAELDVHGVSPMIDETPELIETSLSEMDKVLSSLMDGRIEEDMQNLQNIYAMAQQQDRSYVEDRSLRLRFLRATKFHVHEAALRLLKLLNLKVDIFGKDYMCEDISIHDDNCFTEKDRECIQSGLMQILGVKDNSGRTVFTWFTSLGGKFQQENRLKLLYYMFMAANRDEECQRKGCVFVLINIGKNGIKDRDKYVDGVTKLHQVARCLPLRFDGFHICTDQEEQKEFASLTKAKTSNRVRIRARHHEGPWGEIKLKLMCFGIPTNAEVFPMTDVDKVDTSIHRAWFQQQLENDPSELSMGSPSAQQEEAFSPASADRVMVVEQVKQKITSTNHAEQESTDTPSFVSHPMPNDVLFGRSGSVRRHKGNILFKSLLDKYEQHYERSELSIDKTNIATTVVQIINKSGGRFLRFKADSKWEIADATASRKKVTNAWRDRRKKRKALVGTKSQGGNSSSESSMSESSF